MCKHFPFFFCRSFPLRRWRKTWTFAVHGCDKTRSSDFTWFFIHISFTVARVALAATVSHLQYYIFRKQIYVFVSVFFVSSLTNPINYLFPMLEVQNGRKETKRNDFVLVLFRRSKENGILCFNTFRVGHTNTRLARRIKSTEYLTGFSLLSSPSIFLCFAVCAMFFHCLPVSGCEFFISSCVDDVLESTRIRNNGYEKLTTEKHENIFLFSFVVFMERFYLCFSCA